MKTSELKQTLARYPQHTLRFILPTGTKIPPHAHVTELARVDKKFVDCGGTFRTESTARLQTWFADDTAHRLDAGKLLKILELGAGLFGADDLTVEVEHEAPFISHFPIAGVEAQDGSLFIRLDTRHTACLAEDKCGVGENACAAPAPGPPAIDFKPLPALKESSCCN